MKTLVTYFTQTGNTEKIAQSIYDSVPGQKEFKKLSEVDTAESFDLVFVGFPIYNFEPPRQIKEFVCSHLKGKSIVLFMTMSLTCVPKDEQMTMLYNLTINNCRSCAQNSRILGVFDSPGELSENTARALLKSPDPQLRAFGMLRDYSIGYPNEVNISEAAAFTENIFKDLYDAGYLSGAEKTRIALE